MKGKALCGLGGLAVLTLVTMQACGSSGDDDATIPNASDGGGADAPVNVVDANPTQSDGSSGGTGSECNANDDCTAKLPVTTPPDCATAVCDTIQHKCHFKAKDSDGDGHTAKNCSAATLTIEAGDDCNDTDPNTFPGAWDGPATDFDAGAGAQIDRCDQKDNDCNGSPDDGKVTVDGGDKTCTCDPNHPLPCYEYSNGVPIDSSTLDKDNKPKGQCKKGARTCDNGVPSACVGAVGPGIVEVCDDIDHDCNGVTGNGGDLVPTAAQWFKDADNDNYGDALTPPKQSCLPPGANYKISIPNTDCNDGDNTVNPGKLEVCDGKDNNCNQTIDEGVGTTWCADGDGDSYCTANCVSACTAPPGFINKSACLSGVDCADAPGQQGVHPGAFEFCGDGIDSNCTGGDSETYSSLGNTCTVGTSGICRRKGTIVCDGAKTNTMCSATPGTATSGGQLMSTDPAIDLSDNNGTYDARWDYSCDHSITVIDFLYTGSFRSDVCANNGDLEANRTQACATLSQAECGAHGFLGSSYFNCESISGFYREGVNLCGRPIGYIGCLWNFYGDNKCDYILNSYTPNNTKVTCK